MHAGEDGKGWKELASWGAVVATCQAKHRSKLTGADWEVCLLFSPPILPPWMYLACCIHEGESLVRGQEMEGSFGAAGGMHA